MYKKVSVRAVCSEDGKGGFFDSLVQAFQNCEGFFTCIEPDGTVTRYELSFHDDVLEIGHQANDPASGTAFEPIVFLVESENDCTVLKQVSFNKMGGGPPETMDDGKKSSSDTSSERTSQQDASSKSQPVAQDAPKTRIPVICEGDGANAMNVDELASLLKHPSASSSCDCPVIVLDEDSLSLEMPCQSGSKKDAPEAESSRTCLQEKKASRICSETSVGGWSVPSLQVCTSQNDADKASCESEPYNEKTCVSSQTMMNNIVEKAAGSQSKGIPIETDPTRKMVAMHDDMYAKDLMKKLTEQNALSKSRQSSSTLPGGEASPMPAISSHLSDKRSVTSLPSTSESQASRSSATLSEKGLRRGTGQMCPKVEYCKSADVDSVVIKITVPENSGIEVVLHKINDEDGKETSHSAETVKDRDGGAQKAQGEADISQTLKQVIKCTSPRNKTAQVSTEALSTHTSTQSQDPSRIMSSIKERKQDLEKNTTKGKVKKMVEFFEKIGEQE